MSRAEIVQAMDGAFNKAWNRPGGDVAQRERRGFVDALEAATQLLTPTRDEIARAICPYVADVFCGGHEICKERAAAVLELLAEKLQP